MRCACHLDACGSPSWRVCARTGVASKARQSSRDSGGGGSSAGRKEWFAGQGRAGAASRLAALGCGGAGAGEQGGGAGAGSGRGRRSSEAQPSDFNSGASNGRGGRQARDLGGTTRRLADQTSVEPEPKPKPIKRGTPKPGRQEPASQASGTPNARTRQDRGRRGASQGQSQRGAVERGGAAGAKSWGRGGGGGAGWRRRRWTAGRSGSVAGRGSAVGVVVEERSVEVAAKGACVANGRGTLAGRRGCGDERSGWGLVEVAIRRGMDGERRCAGRNAWKPSSLAQNA